MKITQGVRPVWYSNRVSCVNKPPAIPGVTCFEVMKLAAGDMT